MRLSTRILSGLAVLTAASTAGAQGSTIEKLSINGYLSQAYARSDSLMNIGMTEDGTTDYRRAALLLRYAISDRESFVVQLGHRRLGESPTMALEDNVKLDWGFYQRKLASETMIRVGKAPIPMGIWNETRFVGTTMPFYRAPFSVYSEGSYTSETIEGVVLSQGIFADSPWRMDLSAYGGSWSFVEAAIVPTGTGPQYAVAEGESKHVLGGQLWLATPLSGVRLGVGGSRFTATGGLSHPNGEKTSGENVQVSVEANLDRYVLRTEAMHVNAGIMRYRGAYAQGSMRIARDFWLNGQAEVSDFRLRDLPFVGTLDLDWERNLGIGVNYQPASNLVWKNEFHWTKGYNYEDPGIDVMGAPIKGSHVISSLSVSF